MPITSHRHFKLHSTGLSVRVTASAGNGSGTYDYDLFTIGGGSGGVRASRFASGNYGAKVALCEMPLDWIASDTAGGVGGTCVLRVRRFMMRALLVLVKCTWAHLVLSECRLFVLLVTPPVASAAPACCG